MVWGVAGAIVVGGALGAAGSIIAGSQQAKGQEAAANTQAGMFNTIVGQEQPFIQAGYGATSTLSDLMKPGGYLTQQFQPTQQQLENYPGYQFSLQTGGQAIRNADTPGVGALSGAALKDLMGFNQGLAQSYYGNYFNQFQTQQNNIFNRLYQLSALGQNAAGNLGTQGAQLGTGIAQAQAAAAGSQAAGIVGATNSIANSAVPLAYLMNGNASTAPSYSYGNTMGVDGGYSVNLPNGW